jgi:hypothetical protein
LSWAGGQVKKRDQQLKDRYGARYTKAMVVTAFIALFLPLPGSTPMAVVVVAVVAEIHRAISKKRRSAPILKEKEATFDRNWAQPGGMAGAG